MASGKWLRLEKGILDRPELSSIWESENGLSCVLIYCTLLLTIGELIPCDKKKLAERIGIAPEQVQEVLNAFYKAGMVHVTEKGPYDQPSFEEIQEYCKEIGSAVDPARFYDCYAADGFKWQGKPMDWKAKLRQWSVRERPKKSGNPFINMLKEETLEPCRN